MTKSGIPALVTTWQLLNLAQVIIWAGCGPYPPPITPNHLLRLTTDDLRLAIIDVGDCHHAPTEAVDRASPPSMRRNQMDAQEGRIGRSARYGNKVGDDIHGRG
jgi:hypothetical protein